MPGAAQASAKLVSCCGIALMPDNHKHKAVIFDLGKVLVHFDFKRGFRALEGLCPYTAAEIPQRIGATGLVSDSKPAWWNPGISSPSFPPSWMCT